MSTLNIGVEFPGEAEKEKSWIALVSVDNVASLF